jgi:hypothetical protein
MSKKNKSTRRDTVPVNKGPDAFRQNISVQQYDELAKEADKERTRKPGSQSNSSGRHNNGRGGGK